MDESPLLPESVDDPRITGQFYRCVPGPCSPASAEATPTGAETMDVERTGTTANTNTNTNTTTGTLYLLGVVHDHPASIGRVMRAVDEIDPSVLALELPPAALPLYRVYARKGGTNETDDGTEYVPPSRGGEMSAAISATDSASLVGIDAPNWSFLRRLVTRLVADRVSPGTARRLLSSLGGATRDALTCRIAATLTDATSMTIAPDDPIEYDCSFDDPPAEQAAHERAHVASVQALLGSLETTDSALAYRDDTRERCMIDRLTEIRSETDDDVVAVVGIDHLERLADELSADS
ncbi:uncharacterized protein Nmag_1414 [Natrialba magadii ATCC 43099]|uniref:TraB family protein n=1 Tax=Natrialba magadii (strain ATCC 43099 / DSM 3394 / CCM 3739 / CIP 104546 / IAM 13178 / JCM 8861 / NBRC 102185 / NCIMB 2190 / MS3) TaxID=547559 RepID=D3ST47_NATMM|nr:hypothetical protein [Natrialba magadii]ADD04993.1 uncharacterized protein Nmag_1414 [Natrialba magadii ATCC 43099]ELY24039.1 hypothetical protein C500_19585 [Natrialba magadii ATCC 43099]